MISKKSLRAIIEDNSSKRGRLFDNFIQLLILVSLISFSVETLPSLSSQSREITRWIEIVCVSIFSLEYVLRVYVSKNLFAYVLSFYGLIDLLAILPFYLAMGIDLRSLRIFRVFRLFRSFKLLRYNKALSRFHQAAMIVKEEIVLFLMVSAIFLFLSATGIFFFEYKAQPGQFSSIFHSLWWATVTLTTVGYGDMVPITMGGKLFTFFVLLIGVGIVTVPAGLISSALSKVRRIEEKNRDNGL